MDNLIIITTVIRTYNKVKPNELTVKEGQEVRVMDATAYIQVSSIVVSSISSSCMPAGHNQELCTYVCNDLDNDKPIPCHLSWPN